MLGKRAKNSYSHVYGCLAGNAKMGENISKPVLLKVIY